jgi:hypothetical protein
MKRNQTFEVFGLQVWVDYEYYPGYSGSKYEPPEPFEINIYKYYADCEDLEQWFEDNELEGWYFEEKLLAEIKDFCQNEHGDEAAAYADYLYDLKREEKLK